jgi:hypothetical protein
MKIAFICGCLEPGHDGVGDYTRKLAGELLKQGHQVTAIAVNDREIEQTATGSQNADGSLLPVLRITYTKADNERYHQLEQYLKEFDADWISLQFVPYSFQIKGIPYNFFNKLSSLKLKVKWHVFFHEIWLDKPERFSQNVVMWLQKLIIYTGIKKLNAKLINTSIPYNQQRLQTIGVQSSILPLFGNIAVNSSEKLPDGFNAVKHFRHKIVYFGGIPRHLFLEQVVNGLESFCKTATGDVAIIIIKSASAEKDRFIELLNSRLSAYQVEVVDCGYLDEEELSGVLRNCTVGIVRSEPYLLGKSGAAIALLEHGTPIWLTKWTDGQSIDYTFRKHLIESSLEKASQLKHDASEVLLPQVAKQFINQLS